jgi:hypothetical protein
VWSQKGAVNSPKIRTYVKYGKTLQYLHTHMYKLIEWWPPRTGANYIMYQKKSHSKSGNSILCCGGVGCKWLYIYIYNKFSLEWSLNLDKTIISMVGLHNHFSTMNRMVKFAPTQQHSSWWYKHSCIDVTSAL